MESFEKHRPLVVFLVGKCCNQEVRSQYYDDLVAEGNIGLLEACRKFDPNRGVKFSNFASRIIVRHIKRFISTKTTDLKLSRGMYERVTDPKFKISYSNGKIRKFGHVVAVNSLQGLFRYDHRAENDEGTCNQNVDGLYLKLEQGNLNHVDRLVSLRGHISELGARARNILLLRFGMNVDGKKMAVVDIARRLKMPVARVKRIIKSNIARLRELLS